MGNKLLHHLLQRVFIIYNHLTQPGIFPITAAQTKHYSKTRSYPFKILVDINVCLCLEFGFFYLILVLTRYLAPCVISWA